MENRGQEGGEAYRRAGAYHPAASRAELRHARAGQKKRTHGLHDGEVHHTRRQVPRCGTEREERRSSPVLRDRERGFGARQYHQRTSSALTMRKYIAIIIASLALFTGQAHAQRCLPKMQGIEVRANLADGFKPGGNDGGYSLGAALSTYTKKGNKWVFGGEYLLKKSPYKDTSIPVAQFTAEGGYYFKILSDARKIVFVYAGASALAGYESVNWGEKVLHDGSTLHDRDAFIYGGALTFDVEFYVADRIALLANLRERCLWGGDTRKFHTQFGVGIKFIIN